MQHVSKDSTSLFGAGNIREWKNINFPASLKWQGQTNMRHLGGFLSAEMLLGSFILQLKSHKTFLFSFISIFIIKRHIINAILTFLAETNFGQFSEPYFVLRSSKYFCFSRSEYLFFILDPLLHELAHLLMII